MHARRTHRKNITATAGALVAALAAVGLTTPAASAEGEQSAVVHISAPMPVAAPAGDIEVVIDSGILVSDDGTSAISALAVQRKAPGQ